MAPALKFSLIFIGSYLLMQFVYTGYLWLYEPLTDPITIFTAEVVHWFMPNSMLQMQLEKSGVQLLLDGRPIINIMEACNAVAVGIAVLAFVISFVRPLKSYLFFVPISFFILFVGNVIRLCFLANIRMNYPQYFVSFHEYIFPVILYAIAFGMMVYWVQNGPKKTNDV